MQYKRIIQPGIFNMKPQFLRSIRRRPIGTIIWLLVLTALSASDFSSIRAYIKQGWSNLRRSNATLTKSTEDGKIGKTASVTLHLPAGEDLDKVRSRLKRELTPAAFQRLRIQKLSPEATLPKIEDQGLLYLPKPCRGRI